MHQASTKAAGTDCLGLLRGVWREVIGVEPVVVPAYSADWSEASGREDLLAAASAWLIAKPLTEEAPGDVLLFRMRPVRGQASGDCGAHRPDASLHAYTGHGVVETALFYPMALQDCGAFQFPEGA